MKLCGKFAELMVLIKPKLYREYVRYPNGHAELYVRMTKALYRMLKSALWFYEKLRDNLEAGGFVINPVHCKQDCERYPNDRDMACG